MTTCKNQGSLELITYDTQIRHRSSRDMTWTWQGWQFYIKKKVKYYMTRYIAYFRTRLCKYVSANADLPVHVLWLLVPNRVFSATICFHWNLTWHHVFKGLSSLTLEIAFLSRSQNGRFCFHGTAQTSPKSICASQLITAACGDLIGRIMLVIKRRKAAPSRAVYLRCRSIHLSYR